MVKRTSTSTVTTIMSDDDVTIPSMIELVKRLSRDLKEAATKMTDEEARFLVDNYYIMQKNRIRTNNQVKALEKTAEPNSTLLWIAEESLVLEKQIAHALDAYSSSKPIGVWAKSITGIGSVIAAGMLAHFDIHKANTVSHFISFAGLNPHRTWNKGEKRPWNPHLKRLMFIVGESFTKVQNLQSDVYGKMFKARKIIELDKNEQGVFAEQAQLALKSKDFSRDTQARAWYEGCYGHGVMKKVIQLELAKRQPYLNSVRVRPGEGVQQLPPARIQLRSQRYAVKMFLSHLHQVWYEQEFKKPAPLPFAIAHLHHVDYIPPPNYTPINDGTIYNGPMKADPSVYDDR